MKKDREKLAMWQERLARAESAYAAELGRMDEREALYAGDRSLRPIVAGERKERAAHVRNLCAELIEAQVDSNIPGISGEEWEQTIFRIAVQQLFADPAVNARHKEIFRRVALEGEKPEAVAASMACSLDVVYQVCSRLKKRLQGVVEALARAEEP